MLVPTLRDASGFSRTRMRMSCATSIGNGMPMFGRKLDPRQGGRPGAKTESRYSACGRFRIASIRSFHDA